MFSLQISGSLFTNMVRAPFLWLLWRHLSFFLPFILLRFPQYLKVPFYNFCSYFTFFLHFAFILTHSMFIALHIHFKIKIKRLNISPNGMPNSCCWKGARLKPVIKVSPLRENNFREVKIFFLILIKDWLYGVVSIQSVEERKEIFRVFVSGKYSRKTEELEEKQLKDDLLFLMNKLFKKEIPEPSFFRRSVMGGWVGIHRFE